jgi:uncharacterized protein (TIGR03067 family)
MRQFLVLLAACVLPAAARPDEKAAKADLAKLEGTWEVTGADVAGKKSDAKAFGVEKLVVKDGKLTLFSGGKELRVYQLTLDPAKTPKATDLVRDRDGAKEQLPCIYQLDGDEFKLGMPLVPKDRKPGEALPRPESFETKDKPVLVLTAKRAKK